MRAFAENENRDIYLAPNGQLATVDGLPAVLQLCKSAVEGQQGEMIYSASRGVPTARAVWDGAPNLQQFEFSVRKVLRGVEGVQEVTQFSAEIVGDSVSYQATIKTVFGVDQINGSV